MRVISSIAEVQAERAGMSGSVGLVPTMGYLHDGHLGLVRRALQDNDHVVVSIFVNPTQFGPNEDLARYPRDLERDLSLLRRLSTAGKGQVATVFVPTVEDIYPPGFEEWVEVRGPLTERLEGAHRPGHFRGVTTIVARLFRIIWPHRAYFGQKDAQQLRVIKRMVEERRMPVEIVPLPTVREPDGLAMSSRNVYLSPNERQTALAIPRSLSLSRRLVMEDGVADGETVRSAAREAITFLSARPEVSKERAEPPHLSLDYASISDEQTLEELNTIDRPALILLAARVGTTRLIDNTIVVPHGVPTPDALRALIEADGAALPQI